MRSGRAIILSVCLLATLACAGPMLVESREIPRFANIDVVFHALSLQDGWLLESAEDSSSGGLSDNESISLRLGDDDGNRQFRSILSFATAADLPDDAIITSASLVLTQQASVLGGSSAFVGFDGLLIDIRQGHFGDMGLDATDFESAADVSAFGPYRPPTGERYTFVLGRGAYPYINKWPFSFGLTQFRLRFKLDDDNDRMADYIQFYSGNETVEARRPSLAIRYHLPSRISVASLY